MAGVQTSYPSAPSAAFAGMLADGDDHSIMPMLQAEASAEIAFGRGVVFKGTPTTDQDAVLPTAETDKFAGIVVYSTAYSRSFVNASGQTAGDLGSTGLVPGAMMNVLRRGVVWAVCEDGCAPGDRLWVRAVAGGDPEFLGGLNNADDSTDMIDCTALGQWLTTAAAGGLAKLEINCA